MAERRQAKVDRQARIEAMRASERARKRRLRLAWLGGGGVVIAAVVAVIAVVAVSGGSGSPECVMLGGSSCRIAVIVSAAVSRWKARCPVTIS